MKIKITLALLSTIVIIVSFPLFTQKISIDGTKINLDYPDFATVEYYSDEGFIVGPLDDRIVVSKKDTMMICIGKKSFKALMEISTNGDPTEYPFIESYIVAMDSVNAKRFDDFTMNLTKEGILTQLHDKFEFNSLFEIIKLYKTENQISYLLVSTKELNKKSLFFFWKRLPFLLTGQV